MDVVLGGLAGLGTGVLGSLVLACALAVGRSLCDRRLARREAGAAQSRPCPPLWILFGLLGLIAGVSWTWRLHGTWMTGAVAGAGAPAFAIVVVLVWMAAQLRR